MPAPAKFTNLPKSEYILNIYLGKSLYNQVPTFKSIPKEAVYMTGLL